MAETSADPAAAKVIKLMRPEGDFECDQFQDLSGALDLQALVCWILGIVAVVMMASPWWNNPTEPNESEVIGDHIAMPTVGLILFVYYVYESFCCGIWKYLASVKTQAQISELSKKLQAAKPKIVFHVQNYVNGVQHDRRINTLRASTSWESKAFKSAMKPMEEMLPKPEDQERRYYFAEFKMDFLCDAGTKTAMEAARKAFAEEKWVDQYIDQCMEYVVGDVPEYTRYALVVQDPDSPDSPTVPFLLTRLCFVLSVICLMTFPYRFFLFKSAPKLDWRISKYLLAGEVSDAVYEVKKLEPPAAEAVPEGEDMPAADGDTREGELRGRSERTGQDEAE